MVQCAIACCTSSDREKGKDYHANLFRVPSLPKPAVYKGKDRAYREKKVILRSASMKHGCQL